MIRSQPKPREAERADGGSERLFEAVRRYDPAALGRLFDSSFASVQRVLIALLGDAATAEDAATATYARALERIDERGSRGGLEGWVTRTACLEAARRRPADIAAGTAPGIGPRPYDPRRVRAALWALPADQREVLGLRVLGGFDAAHVAAAGGRSVRLVLNLQQRALRSLARENRRFGRGSEEALERGLERVTAGATVEAAVAAVPGLGEQQALLEAAWAARTLLPSATDPAARERVRSALLAEAAELRANWVHRHQGIAPPVAPRRRPLRTAGRLATGTFLAIVAVIAGLALAGFAVTSEPDSPVYPLRRMAENVLVLAHRSAPSRAELEVDLADQRLREADAMALNGHAALAVQSIHDRYVELEQAARALIDDSGPHDSSWMHARAKLLSDETAGLSQVEDQLTAHGDGWAAQQVRSELTAFQSERSYLDQELGANPRSTPAQATPPPPGYQPSAVP